MVLVRVWRGVSNDKSGKQDKARVTYRGSVGMSAPINMPEMMNSVEFANL